MKARAFQMTSSALSGSAESYRGEPAWCESRQPIHFGPVLRTVSGLTDPGQRWCMGLILCFFHGPPSPRVDALIP
jgi:hypothetical protein